MKTRKSIMALLLVVALIVPQALSATAVQPTLKELPAERIATESLPEGNFVYFGIANTTVDEEDSLYLLPIYREGDLSQPAEVSIHALDISAIYGKDYCLQQDKVVYTGTEKTMMEQIVDPESTITSLDPEAVDDALAAVFPEEKGVEIVPTPDLAQKKEDQTGLQTVIPSNDGNNELFLETLGEQLVPAVTMGLAHSAEINVKFAAGEAVKYLNVRIFDDEKSEGDESFSLNIVETKGADVYRVPTASFIIRDDEPVVRPVVSFSDADYHSDNGEVTVSLVRQGADYAPVTMNLLSVSDTAFANINYQEVSTIVAFAPYEMEQTITIPVSGSGEFELKISDCKGGEFGDITKARVFINEPEAQLLASASRSFKISVENKEYSVEYEPNAYVGKILDMNYSPALHVGNYYFPLPHTEQSGKLGFYYGLFGGKNPDPHVKVSQYVEGDPGYGELKYYKGLTGYTGYAETVSSAFLNPIYFQCLGADWMATSDTGSHRYHQFNAGNAYHVLSVGEQTPAKDWRHVSTITVPSDDREHMWSVSVRAEDRESNLCPQSYTNFYGIAAMFKKYVVSMAAPEKMTFISDVNSTVSSIPAQAKAKCGAQLIDQNNARALYTVDDGDQSNMVFSLQPVTINGKTDKFGTLDGYQIKIDSPKMDGSSTAVYLDYPADFIAYLKKQSGNSTETLDYSSSAVSREIDKITNNLDTVPYDAYFTDWIMSEQKNVHTEGSTYYQKLVFTPVYQYNNVQVRVIEPSVTDIEDEKGGGHFSKMDLVAGKTYTYHAGDRLNLEAKSDDTDGHRVVGYEYSTDGGVSFNTVRDDKYLVLQPNTNYIIRPAIVADSNRIEIKFDKNVKPDMIEVVGLIPQSELKGTDYEGKNILDIAPNKAKLSDRMAPAIGHDYSIDILVKKEPTNSDLVYRPYIVDGMTKLKYNSQRYDMTARKNVYDNILTIGVEAVPKSSLKTFNLSGSLLLSMASIVNDGLGVHGMPVPGYTVVGCSGQTVYRDAHSDKDMLRVNTLSAITDENGNFTIEKYTGCNGDRITVSVSNGIMDSQIFDIVIGTDADSVNAGTLELHYPLNTPRVVSLSYHYGIPGNDLKEDLTSNSIALYDDSLIVTAVIDPAGRKIAKAEFIVKTITGQQSRFEAAASQSTGGDNIFVCTIPKMTENLHNGDRLYVSLIDEEKITFEGSSNELEIKYPTVQTGYVFYIENVFIAPKHMNIETDIEMKMSALGNCMPKLSSGLLSFDKTPWPNGAGFSYTVNIGGLVNTIPNLTTQQKTDAYQKLISDSKKVWQAKQDGNTDYENTGEALIGELTGDVSDKENLDLNKEVEKGENRAEIAKNGAKDSKIKLHKDFTYQFSTVITLGFDFLYDPITQEHYLAQSTQLIGGTFSGAKTFYWSIYGVPLFLNLNGAVQMDAVFSERIEHKNLSTTTTAAEFDEYAGDIKEKITALDDAKLQFLGNLKVQAGCGFCGILAARGFAGLLFQADISLYRKNHGALFEVSGGIGFDLVILSVDVNLAQVRIGLGTLKNASSYGFFGSLLGGKINYDSAPPARTAKPIVSASDYGAGTSTMEDFGAPNYQGMPVPVRLSVLKDGAADRTRPVLLGLEDGRKFLLFIGSREAEGPDAMCLYYTICDLDGAWSQPKIVADDGTFDSTPTAIVSGDRILIAWADADKSLSSDDNFKTKLNALGISSAVYDLKSSSMSQEFTVIEDEYFNLAPSLNLINDQVYCTYMKRDISDITKPEQLINFSELGYSTMAYVSYNLVTGEKAPEILVPILDEELIEHQMEPLVLDYQSVTASSCGRDFILTTYTVDKDASFATNADRELYLGINDMTNNKSYFPIRITRDQNSQGIPKLTILNGDAYLTWTTNGTHMSIANINILLDALFDEELAGRVYIDADPMDPNWYRKEASELPMSQKLDEEQNEFDYEGSLYDRLAHGGIVFHTANLRNGKDSTRSITDYQVVTNGEDIYIFYTDFSNDLESTGVELYGIRYQNPDFSIPVQITNYDKVIDELDIIMNEDNEFSVVSNYFSQSIAPDGSIQYSNNKLVEIDFEPRGSVKIKEGSLKLDSYNTPGVNGEISFTVQNEGLLKATGFDVNVSVMQDGVETAICNEHCDVSLDTMETMEFSIPWEIPSGLEDVEITAVVSETDVAQVAEDRQVLNAGLGAKLEISPLNITYGEDEFYAETTIQNIGNADSEPGTVTLSNSTDIKNVIPYTGTEIPALKPGERTTIQLSFKPTVAEFEKYCGIDLVMDVSAGDLHEESNTSIFHPSALIAEINNGDEYVNVEVGGTVSLNVQAAPWNDIAGQVMYTTENGDIATVDSTGLVTGHRIGTTVITATYSESGIRDSIKVTVTGDGLPFTDVAEKAWYYDSVVYAYEHGIMNGFSDTAFKPYSPLSREQLVQILYNRDGTVVNPEKDPFKDVTPNDWSYAPIIWAAGQGYVEGYSDGTFAPKAPITREQLVTILWRYAGKPSANSSISRFKDADKVSSYALTPVKWAVSNHILEGRNGSVLDPSGLATRAEAAKMIQMFAQNTDSET